MKKNIIYLQMSALFLAAALPVAMAAEVPFRGSFEAVETAAVQFPTVTIAGIGNGNERDSRAGAVPVSTTNKTSVSESSDAATR